MLCVDLDPQGNLSDYFDVTADADADDRATCSQGNAKAKAATHDGIIPATLVPRRGRARRSSGKMGRELALRKALKDARKQHDIILDRLPAGARPADVNGLVAADWALISLRGAVLRAAGRRTARSRSSTRRKESYNDDLEWLGVVFNIADMRTVHSREALRGAQGALRRQGVRDR